MDGTDGRDDDLSSAEAARLRRRERERTAKERELMRTGQAKAFKQILDAQAKRAAEAKGTGKRVRRSASPANDRSDDGAPDPPPPNR